MRWSRSWEEQIIAPLKGQDAGAKMVDVCRRHGNFQPTRYAWKARCGDMEASDAKLLKALEEEYRKPK